MHGSLRAWAILALPLIAGGCGWKPSAPVLQDEPVYRDRREGFRFFVPDGWKQHARGEVPQGKISGERMLVEYKCFTCSMPATLMVTVSDVPTSTALSEYLAKNTLTGEKWRLRMPAEDYTLNGVPAARITYIMPAGKDEMIRDIVAFRRGERVYFFKGFYAASDAKSRKALQAAVDTIVW